MIITLIILSFILGGYSLYLIKKLNKETFITLNELKLRMIKKNLYLLKETDNKIEISKKLLLEKLDNKLKTNEESFLKKLKEINNQNQKDNDTKHQQLISNEFKKLRSDINKDLDDIIESVKNIKIV
jgi:hypothetical protein